MTERVLAVVIGRAGSQGLPGKNAAVIGGRPLLAHAIAHAQHAACVDDVIVSTDGAKLAAIAERAGVRVIDRPAALATSTATVADAVRDAVVRSGSDAGIIVILYANIPIRPADLIDRAVACLREHGADSVQSYTDVGKFHPWWMVRLDDDDRVAPFHPNPIDRRQDLPPLFLPDGGVLAVRRAPLLESAGGAPHDFLGSDRRGIRTASGEVIDVDTAHDLALAEARLRGHDGA